MDANDRETDVDRFMAGWPGLLTAFFTIAWMLLVGNNVFPGIGWIFGKWGKLIDLLPGMFSIYLVAFGIVGERTWVGKRIRWALILLIVGAIIVSFLSGGGGNGSNGCSRATPQFC